MADTIISASRRTDIPGLYTPWFMDCIRRREAVVVNPFNRKTRTVDLDPASVYAIVFWSKNFGPFLDLEAHRQLQDLGYNLFFNFTVNTAHPLLEPGLPDLSSRLAQAETLCRTFSGDQVAWRFDPICFFEQDGQTRNNLADFAAIARRMADAGVSRCITSFYDPYAKVDRRITRMHKAGSPAFRFTDPGLDKKTEVVRRMADRLDNLGIKLFLCCEAGILSALEGTRNVAASACIDSRLLGKRFGGSPSTARDQGQRKDKGCTCSKSVDIGSYQDHPCRHNCLFCYARTETDTSPKNTL